MNYEIDQRNFSCPRKPDRQNILTEAQVSDKMFKASWFTEYDAVKHTKLRIWLGIVTRVKKSFKQGNKYKDYVDPIYL